jgi:catecholate siderophore receptor
MPDTDRPHAPTRLQPTLGLASLGFLSAAAAVAADPARAQTAPPAEGALALPEMTVQEQAPSPYRRDDRPLPRLPTSVADTPQSVTVVPREVIQERAATTVRDALRNVTGISLSAGEGGFSGDNLTLRGFSARGDFFIDGIRDIGQYTRDSFFLESVDVLKGPSSVMFGRGSTGGVINQTTRLPLAITAGEVWLSGYTPGGMRSTADVNVRAGDVAVRLNAMATHIDAANRDHVFNERWGLFPAITFGIGGPTTLTLSYLHQQERNMPDLGVPYLFGRPLPVSTNTFYGLNGVDGETTQTDVFTARFEHRFNEGIQLRNTFRWANYSRELSATAPRLLGTVRPGTDLSLVRINRQPQVRNGLDTQLVNQTELALAFDTFGLRHSAIAGVEIGRESSEAVRFAQTGRPVASAINPDWNDSGRLVTTPNSDVKTVANTFAIYAVDQIRIGEMFELLLGGRWDSFDAQQDNRFANQSFDRYDSAFSWRGALVFKPVPAVRTYFAYGTSFNPSAEALTLAANNADLAPEENRSFELGAAWEVSQGLRLTGAVFRIEKTNARTADPANATLQVLDGEVRVDGLEIQAVGRLAPGWNLLAGYTLMGSEITRSNNPAEVGKEYVNVPPNSVSVWTTYDLPGGFQLGGGLNYVDRRWGNTTNTVRAPAYTRFDAALAWSPVEGALKGLRLQVNALNLGDARTYDTVYSGHVVPGVGRTFVFSAAARF